MVWTVFKFFCAAIQPDPEPFVTRAIINFIENNKRLRVFDIDAGFYLRLSGKVKETQIIPSSVFRDLEKNTELSILGLPGGGLNISSCTLAKVLKNNKGLRRLNINGVNVCIVDTQALAHAITTNRRLEELDLRGVCIPRNDIQKLIRALSSNRTLRMIRIGDFILNRFIGPDAKEHLFVTSLFFDPIKEVKELNRIHVRLSYNEYFRTMELNGTNQVNFETGCVAIIRRNVVLDRKVFAGNGGSAFIRELILEKNRLLSELIVKAHLEENDAPRLLWMIFNHPEELDGLLNVSHDEDAKEIKRMIAGIHRVQNAIVILLPLPEEMEEMLEATPRFLESLYMGMLPQGWDRSDSWEDISRALSTHREHKIEKERVEEKYDLVESPEAAASNMAPENPWDSLVRQIRQFDAMRGGLNPRTTDLVLPTPAYMTLMDQWGLMAGQMNPHIIERSRASANSRRDTESESGEGQEVVINVPVASVASVGERHAEGHGDLGESSENSRIEGVVVDIPVEEHNDSIPRSVLGTPVHIPTPDDDNVGEDIARGGSEDASSI